LWNGRKPDRLIEKANDAYGYEFVWEIPKGRREVMTKGSVRILSILISFVIIFQLIACGTILHPERKGQTGGRIDPGVAILDGIGLLFFIIPGVIAYAVDFSNGTIYLPGTSTSSLNIEDLKHVRFDPEHDTMADIEKIIKKETGYDVALGRDSMEIFELTSTDDMMAHFAEARPEIEYTRTALYMR
jgi:hypothetical protein